MMYMCTFSVAKETNRESMELLSYISFSYSYMTLFCTYTESRSYNKGYKNELLFKNEYTPESPTLVR